MRKSRTEKKRVYDCLCAPCDERPNVQRLRAPFYRRVSRKLVSIGRVSLGHDGRAVGVPLQVGLIAFVDIGRLEARFVAIFVEIARLSDCVELRIVAARPGDVVHQVIACVKEACRGEGKLRRVAPPDAIVRVCIREPAEEAAVALVGPQVDIEGNIENLLEVADAGTVTILVVEVPGELEIQGRELEGEELELERYFNQVELERDRGGY